jgi:hypothetical protein
VESGLQSVKWSDPARFQMSDIREMRVTVSNHQALKADQNATDLAAASHALRWAFPQVEICGLTSTH